jgi:Domain of unknown function (DUF4872)/Butirosin biosynthesis protein H, N-terminal
MTNNTDFQHRQSAHCESGVISSLLSHYGLPMSEPMAFGLAGTLAFAYLPFIKLSGMPLIAYRTPPRSIIKRLQKRLGLKIKYQTFRNQDKGMSELDKHLNDGRIVGLQTSVYWLPYFPEDMRFHFNAHNLIAYGKEQNDYLVSDPVFETPTRCDSDALKKSRFAKGALAARGLMYYPEHIPKEINYQKTIRSAIKSNYRIMNGAPLPMIGIRGIRYLGDNIIKLSRQKNKQQYLPLYLSHIIRMQEEIGTGGAGFRFIYASFLQESANLLDSQLLHECSAQMTDAGDQWRLFALLAAKMCKGRKEMDPELLANTLYECAEKELACWNRLKVF